MSIANDAVEARRAERDWERFGPPGGERERLARLDPTFDHPWLVCLCPGCTAKRDAYRYPGPCTACGSELRRPSLHLIDGQGSVLCRAGYLHTTRPSTAVRDTPSTPVSNLPHGGE